MKFSTLVSRFLPGFLVTFAYWLRFGCRVSPRAEVDLTRQVKIGRRTQISSFTKIKAVNGPLVIGRDVSIGTGCFLEFGTAGMSVGDDCLISPHVTVLASNYRYDRLDVPIRGQGLTSRGVSIGNDVWLGVGVVVLDGSDIGDGAIVAPNAVVSGRIPANAVAQGNPAKVIFQRR